MSFPFRMSHWPLSSDMLSDLFSTKRAEKIFLTWPDGSSKSLTWSNSKIISESYGFVKSNSFQNLLDLNQPSNQKLLSKRNPRKLNNKRNQLKRRNNNPKRNNNLKNKNKPKKKSTKTFSLRRRPTHWTSYPSQLSTLKVSKEKSVTLKTS